MRNQEQIPETLSSQPSSPAPSSPLAVDVDEPVRLCGDASRVSLVNPLALVCSSFWWSLFPEPAARMGLGLFRMAAGELGKVVI